MWTPIEAIFRLEAEGLDRADDGLLEVTAVLADVAAVPVQVEDGVADELARSVERGLPAAVGLDHLDLGAGGKMKLAVFRAPAERDHGRMLEEENRVRPRAREHLGRDRTLEVPGLLVGDAPELQDLSGDHRPHPSKASRRPVTSCQ